MIASNPMVIFIPAAEDRVTMVLTSERTATGTLPLLPGQEQGSSISYVICYLPFYVTPVPMPEPIHKECKQAYLKPVSTGHSFVH